jgi:DNA invertase Pin-like site-specific DNA recombinase
MLENHSINGRPEPVAAYYRMSDDKQENSIERQRSQVEPYAAQHGYVIVREYVDEGIAGDEAEKRPGFMKLTRDAVGRQGFRVILCDDKDRFGRFDAIDFGYHVKPLRDAGVRLETVAQGRVDWTSFAGRVADIVAQEAKAMESRANSGRVLGEMLRLAGLGYWLGGPAPYGYVLVPDPVLGKKLVPGDPEKVAAVRLIFTLYAEGHSPDAIAGTLTQRGVLNPSGTEGWNRSTVRVILRRRAYVGDKTWNASHEGKFSEVRGGVLFKSECRLPTRAVNPQDDWIIVLNTHEPLIARDLWERVQARLEANGESRRAVVPSGNRNVYPLGGLLVCGHCGWCMIGSPAPGGKFYKCGKYHDMGKHACHANHVGEARLVRGIVAKLAEVLLNPEVLELFRKAFREQAEDRARATAPRLKQARKQIDSLEAQIAQGVARMASIPADLLTEYAAVVRGWKEERDRLRREVERLEKGTPVAEVNKLLGAFEAAVNNLEDILASCDPVRVRSLLVQFVDKVELHFDHRQTPKQTRSRFREGLLYLKPQQGFDLSCLVRKGARPLPTAPGTGT